MQLLAKDHKSRSAVATKKIAKSWKAGEDAHESKTLKHNLGKKVMMAARLVASR